MDRHGNVLRIKFKVRNINASAPMLNDNDRINKRTKLGMEFCPKCGMELCPVAPMSFDSKTTMDKGLLLFQPPTPVTADQRSSSSSSPSAVVDCSTSLPSWSLTGPRRWKRTSSTTTTTASASAVPIFGDHSDELRSRKRKVQLEDKKNEISTDSTPIGTTLDSSTDQTDEKSG